MLARTVVQHQDATGHEACTQTLERARRVFFELAADAEERRCDAVRRQDVEIRITERVRTVVDCERYVGGVRRSAAADLRTVDEESQSVRCPTVSFLARAVSSG